MPRQPYARLEMPNEGRLSASIGQAVIRNATNPEAADAPWLYGEVHAMHSILLHSIILLHSTPNVAEIDRIDQSIDAAGNDPGGSFSAAVVRESWWLEKGEREEER